MTTVRLDPATRAELERLAEERGQTRSEVIRDAISRLGGEHGGEGRSALDRLRPFLGVADSGGRQLSTNTGRRFRAALEERRNARRPR